jgi:hypothetical protein
VKVRAFVLFLFFHTTPFPSTVVLVGAAYGPLFERPGRIGCGLRGWRLVIAMYRLFSSSRRRTEQAATAFVGLECCERRVDEPGEGYGSCEWPFKLFSTSVGQPQSLRWKERRLFSSHDGLSLE